ncbi:MAG TPA: BatA domain-containing protein [Planctomycetota bacterium]|nr:BatA domain-containing protein [Planctomycetota bacterium]
MGASFLHTGLAWATLLLISIPIIIHLINRRRFRRIDWAAMEFLLQALKRNRRRIRLEQLILLLLRVALMVLLGLFLARPVLSDRGLEWLASAFRSEEKVFLLDDSFSTARREADRSAFQRETEALGSQVRRLSERGGGDRLTIVRASRHRNPLARGVFVDPERAASLLPSLARLTPTDVRLTLPEALDSIAEGTAREGGDAVARPRVVSILTDLRATDWTDRGGPDEALRQALLRLARSEEAPARLQVLDAGSDDTSNAAITDAALEGGRPTVDIPADVRVEVRNFGAAPLKGLGLRIRYAPAPASLAEASSGSSILGPPLGEVPPGESRSVTVPCTFRAAGHYGLVAELTGSEDSLPGDDSFLLAVEVVTGTDILLVSGEPSSEPYEGETDFLAEALAPAGDVASGIRPTVVVEDGFPRQGLDRFAAIFLANLHSVPEEALPLLGRYVRAGGTLIVFPGDQADAALANRQMGPGIFSSPTAPPGTPGASSEPLPQNGLLPARFAELQSPELAVGFSPALDHPYFRLLKEAGDLLSMVRFEKFFALEPLPAAQVIARFQDVDASPAIVEHSVDAGRVILFASAADLEWNDWPRSPTYLMTLQEIVAGAARSRARRTEHIAGRPVEVPVDIATHAREARLRPPGHPAQPERTLVAAPAPVPVDGASPGAQPGFRFVIEDTERAGLYALAVKSRSGEEEWRQIAVRRDPAESDLSRVSAAKLRQLYPEVEMDVIKDASGFSDAGRGSFEVSDFLLWTFIAFLFVEAFFARWFARHRASAEVKS